MKRSDLDTRTVLEAVRQGGPYGKLTSYPSKAVTAALERELRAGRIDYGVSLARPWLTDQGVAWLTGIVYDELNIISRTPRNERMPYPDLLSELLEQETSPR